MLLKISVRYKSAGIDTKLFVSINYKKVSLEMFYLDSLIMLISSVAGSDVRVLPEVPTVVAEVASMLVCRPLKHSTLPQYRDDQ